MDLAARGGAKAYTNVIARDFRAAWITGRMKVIAADA